MGLANHQQPGEPIGLLLRGIDANLLRAQIAEARAAGRPVMIVGQRHSRHRCYGNPATDRPAR